MGFTKWFVELRLVTKHLNEYLLNKCKFVFLLCTAVLLT